MFIRRKKFYEECARLLAKEDARAINSGPAIVLRSLVRNLEGDKGLKEVNRIAREIGKQKRNTAKS